MFRYELKARVLYQDGPWRIVARTEYEDGTRLYCVRKVLMREDDVQEDAWVAESALKVDESAVVKSEAQYTTPPDLQI